ncbi:MAG: Flp family type IVb pilin [Pseudomonas sp.]
MFLTYLILRLRIFLGDTKGASAIEYAIIASMVSLVVILFIGPLGDQMKVVLNKVLVALGGTAL